MKFHPSIGSKIVVWDLSYVGNPTDIVPACAYTVLHAPPQAVGD